MTNKACNKISEESLAILYKGDVIELFDCEDEHIKHGEPVVFSDSMGRNMFWHTSAHVLAYAIQKLYPQALPVAGPATEKGFFYDFANLQISEEDIPEIELTVRDILNAGVITTKKMVSSAEAKELFQHNPFKLQIINNIKPNETITCYMHSEFFDLCRGPHLSDLTSIIQYKIMGISGSSCELNGKPVSLTRIHAISFPSKEAMDQFESSELVAKERSHKRVGSKLGLFMLTEHAPGQPLFMPHGMRVFHALTEWLRKEHVLAGYEFVKTPTIMNKSVWEQSGHWQCYKDNMYIVKQDADDAEHDVYAIKAMNCPGAALYMASQHHSYKSLPVRLFEFGYVFRKEASGALSGLFRVRAFHQDDSHIFLTSDQVQSEITTLLNLAKKIYSTFSLNISFLLSTRPAKSIGDDAMWEQTERALRLALDSSNIAYLENPGDGAFYGPKIDINIMDALGRKWQCGTIQLDMGISERFDISYLDSDGQLKRPMVIHRAVLGSIERFLGILLEHCDGRLPFFLSPRHLAIITVSDRFVGLAESILFKLKPRDIFVTIYKEGSVGKRIAKAKSLYYNYLLVVGHQEEDTGKCVLEGRANDKEQFDSIEYMIDFLIKKLYT